MIDRIRLAFPPNKSPVVRALCWALIAGSVVLVLLWARSALADSGDEPSAGPTPVLFAPDMRVVNNVGIGGEVYDCLTYAPGGLWCAESSG